MTGVDPSAASLAAARAHAAAVGLPIEYRRGTGEELPFPEASFDLTCCCDVLEHVRDLPRVVAEVARVLRPGGVFFYDTINRTLRSRLVVIKLFQEWPSTRFMPPDLHDWQLFIKPAELRALLAGNGLESRGVTGVKPRVNPLRTLRILRARQRGELSYREAVERLGLGPSRDESILYMGYAVRSGGAIA